jgi:hypothetical protein
MVIADISSELEAMCRKIERSFPGAMCAYQGFAHPRMPVEDVEVVVEVFLAPRGSSRSITRLTHEDTRLIWRNHRVSVAVVAHYVHDTLRYYIGDVLAILSTRAPTCFLDPGGFREGIIPDVAYGGRIGSWGLGRTMGCVNNAWGVKTGASRGAWGKRVRCFSTASSAVCLPEAGHA